MDVAVVANGRRIVAGTGPDVTFGREPTCTVMLADDRVSRRHAVLKRDGDGWTFTDLASSNGSFVGLARITSIRVDRAMSVHLGAVDGPEIQLSPITDVGGTTVAPRPRRTVITAAVAAIVALAVAGTGTYAFRSSPAPSQSGTPTAAPTRLSRADIVARARNGTVYIAQANGHGSGIYLGSGLVLTAAHVVTNGGTITVSFQDVPVGSARVLSLDSTADLALLTIPGIDKSGATALVLGDSTQLNLGEDIVAVGYPISLPFTAKVGVVSGLPRSRGIDLVQTDASLNPGMSGGPLLNERGEVVGVIDFNLPDYAGLDFAIASKVARGFVDRAPKP